MRSPSWRAVRRARLSPHCLAAAGARRAPAPVWLCLVAALATAGCAEPPHKEMHQAQGAIDAARAAGAERYAAGEYTAAVDALRLSHDAVADGDYRLALNYALESRERAQNAAREAAETGARVRSGVERAMADTEASLARADAQIEALGPKLPRNAQDDAQRALAAIRDDVQEAGAAIAEEDYLAAQPLLEGQIARIEAVMAAVEEAVTSQPPRRR